MVTAAMKLKDTYSLKKSYDKPRQCIKKNRDTTLSAKVHVVKVLAFLIVIYGMESWITKKTKH